MRLTFLTLPLDPSPPPLQAPFPVLARSSFGVFGAVLPALLRGLVAAGWFGLNTWLGGAAIHQMLQTLTGGTLAGGATMAALGITWAQGACFLAFWAMQVGSGSGEGRLQQEQRASLHCPSCRIATLRLTACLPTAGTLQVGILLRGMEGIRLLEKYSAPVLIALTAALVAWAGHTAGGFGPMLAAPSQFAAGGPQAGQLWAVFLPALSAQIGYWATLALNICDFTR